MTQGQQVVVGLDNGGTTNNATVLDAEGRFLVDVLVETPSRVREGPAVAVEALAESFEQILLRTGTARESVLGIGLDTPGPASADGVISFRGAVNFADPAWRGFDIRGAFEARIGLPVVYNNDANAASLYAHHRHFGADASGHSSAALIVGTGLGGGLVESGQVVRGAAGMAGELGHLRIPMDGLLADGQPVPDCNCGLAGDAESIASLSGIVANLLPYWLTRYPDHPLATAESPRQAAKLVRGYGEAGDPMAREIFRQQAIALARLFTMAAGFTDPDIYFLGGGVVEAAPEFRDWFLGIVREHTDLRDEQASVESFALVPDLDMAGARGSAIAASEALRGGRLSLVL
jgi:predicted NBD/HSP70 family sugar kinase